MNRIFKRIASSILAAAVAICSVNAVAFADYESADETGINESFGIQYPVETGNDFTFTEISDEEMDSIVAAVDAVPKFDYNEDDSYLGQLGYSNYSSHYFYDQLSSELKSAYNQLYDYCLKLECSEDDAITVTYSDGTTGYLVGYATISGNTLAVNDLSKFYSVFYYENPRFYFMEQGCSYSTSNGYITKIAMTCNESFYQGSVRATESTKMHDKVSSILNAVDAISDPVAKEDYIAKYICDNTVYEKVDHHQSAYGALVAGKAVCAGYTNAYSLLCSAAGLETTFTCSPNHVWNRVKYYDNWYCTDVTWMDGYETNGKYVEKWHNKSYSTFVNNDDSNGSHSIESKMSGYTLPDCIYDVVQLPPVVTATLSGYTLSLNGNIGVNFYVEFSDGISESSNAYMQFTLPNGKVEKVNISDARKNTATAGKTYYIFPCEVASYEMTKAIKAQVFYENESISGEYSYSVRDYGEYIIEHPSSYAETDVTFAKSLLNYGACAQTYFDVAADDLANKSLDPADKNTDVTADSLAEFKVDVKSNELGSFAGYSLILKSETTLKIYFEPANGVDVNGLAFKAAGQTVTPVKSGDYYVLSVENIKAWDLDTPYAFSVTDGANTLDYSCSALAYVYSVLSHSNQYDSNLVKLTSALRIYQQSAEVYVK